MFLVSIPYILGNGVYLFQLFDQFSGTIPLLLVGLFEAIAIGWVFGVKRYIPVAYFGVCRVQITHYFDG